MNKAEERAKNAEGMAKKREKRDSRAKKRSVLVLDTQAKKRKITSKSAAAAVTLATSDLGSSTNFCDCGTGSSSLRNYLRWSKGAHSHRCEDELDGTINSNVCCVGYSTFEDDQQECTGLEWVQCVCGRSIRSANAGLRKMTKAESYFSIFVSFMLLSDV